jgi:NDP-sugar pyrophosphorylase family protein
MKAILICPGERAAVAALSEPAPLSNLLILGKTLIEYWLEHLASRGAREVRVLACDRPERVRALVGTGSRWGLGLTVSPELREPTLPEALRHYQQGDGWMPAPDVVNVMDYLPGFSAHPLFESYQGFVAAEHALMPRVAGPDRIGLRQVQPGVWLGLRARVSKGAHLRPPCWIGDEAFVSRDAVIGPMAVLETRSMIEAGAEVVSSVVGPDTLVGEHAALRHSIAWGGTLINWQLDSCVRVSDPFLISSLARGPTAKAPARRSERLAPSAHGLLDFPLLKGWNVRKESMTWKFSQRAKS